MNHGAPYEPHSDHPRFGENCPWPKDLQTGDLLFPRRLKVAYAPAVVYAAAESGGSGSTYSRRTLRELIRQDNDVLAPFFRDTRSANTGFGPDITRLRFSPLEIGMSTHTSSTDSSPSAMNNAASMDYTSLLADPYDKRHPFVDSLRPKSLPDMSQEELDRWLLLILKISLHAIPEQWLDMTVDRFHKHPIWEFLVAQLLSPDPTLSFFVGHVGVVLKEAGSTWVIEANITDYSHYRVAVHPYYVADEVASFGPENPGESKEDAIKSNAARLRGWVNRRCALGELTWWARPDELNDDDRRKLPNIAKRYLGRPYGFFDHPDIGHHNRLYCSEFVYRIFGDLREDLQASIDDQRTWDGMAAHLNAAGEKDQETMVRRIKKELGNDPKFAKFFVLPPALLWRSNGLSKKNPQEAGGKSYA